MNMKEEQVKDSGYNLIFDTNEYYFKLIFGDLNHFYALTPTSLRIIQGLFQIDLMLKRKQKHAEKYFQKIVKELLKWEKYLPNNQC